MKGGTMLFTGEVRSVNGYRNINVGPSSFSEEQEKLNQKNIHNEEVDSSGTQYERSSLIITNIQPNDAGEYTCRIMIRSTDEINVNHTIIVQVKIGFIHFYLVVPDFLIQFSFWTVFEFINVKG